MAYLGSLGSSQSSATGSTLDVTATSTIPAGTVLVLAAVWDNIDLTTPTLTSLSSAGGGTWTERATGSSGVTASAGAGIFSAVWTVQTVTEIAASATITTVTWSSASTDTKSVVIVGFDNQLEILRGAVVSGTSTGGTPSVTTSTAPITNDVVIGVIAGENNAAPSADADTLNGSWSSISSINTTGGGGASNTTIGIQAKTVTAGGNQTYNATTAADSVAFVFTFATPLIVTLSGQSSSGGSIPVRMANTATLTGQSTTTGSAQIRSLIRSTLSGQSNTTGSLAGGLRRPATLSGQSTSTGAAQIRATIRSTLSGQSTTTGSLAAFRAQGTSASGMSMSSGSGTVKAVLAPRFTAQATSAGTMAPRIIYLPTFTGQSNAGGSIKIGLDYPGTMTAFGYSYGALGAGKNSFSILDGQSTSAGGVAATFSLSSSFIGWGSPI